MRYRKLGSTGLDVSRIALGCMSYGEPGRGSHPWSLDEASSRPFIKAALDAGINFFDTANTYSAGSSEEIVGRALADYANRDEIVLATKVFFPVESDGRNRAGLSRKAIMAAIDASLRRLGTDYVDLYQIHRWDPHTPIEETLEALHDVVKAGKARYLGASSMWAWQFSKALHVADSHGWTRFVTMQNHYNLLYREEEREMLPLCADRGHRRHPVEPAGPWSAHPGLGRGQRPRRHRRVRQDALRRRRPAHRRRCRHDRRGARRAACPGRARLAPAPAGRHRTDRRSDQAAPPR